jgi:NitT/TauT family transport system permease protein
MPGQSAHVRPNALERSGGALAALAIWIAGSLAVFAVLEWVTRLEIVPAAYFPYASTVASRIPELLGDPGFLGHARATLMAWGLSLAAAVAFAVPLGIAFGSSDVLFRAMSPVVDLMRPIPSVALLPLAMLVLGTGLEMKVVLVGYAMAWPILFNTIYGIHDLDPVSVDTARCFGLKRLAIIRHVGIPSAAPFILTGIRVSASIGLVVLVSAELLSDSNAGIGSFIMRNSSGGGRMDTILAAAAIVGLLGLLVNVAFWVIERWQFAWRFAGEQHL